MEKPKQKRRTRADKISLTKKQRVQLETLAGVGMTVEQIADYLGVSKSTLDRRISEEPEVADALRAGRSKAHGKVLQAAYDMATDKKHSDFTKFYLRSRYNWSEKQEIEISGGVELKPEEAFLKQLSKMNKEELEEFVAQGRKKTGD